ncbi:unnamed protein product [Adineta ricciae]|uniref:MORN repeat protein n=1 Tax=Adineta ricciae TaxID=249248 RepID=A0A815EHZ2_ADIRI|nr:unnamed protein product [Adineta ricciae]CAF1306908.1 unnamed protein product [Adineta ricciae]
MDQNCTDDEHTYERLYYNTIPSVRLSSVSESEPRSSLLPKEEIVPERTSHISINEQRSYLLPVPEKPDLIKELPRPQSPVPSKCITKKTILYIAIVTLVMVVISACVGGVIVFKVVLKNTHKITNGTLILGDSTYVGEIFDGQAQGYGTLTKLDGRHYVGNFNINKLDGQGMLFVRDGSGSAKKVYEGNFLENKFDGPGVYYYRDGSRYEGTWENNLRHGDGKIVFADGRSRGGQWAYDKLIENANTIKTK